MRHDTGNHRDVPYTYWNSTREMALLWQGSGLVPEPSLYIAYRTIPPILTYSVLAFFHSNIYTACSVTASTC